jgi:hypothetical protein
MRGLIYYRIEAGGFLRGVNCHRRRWHMSKRIRVMLATLLIVTGVLVLLPSGYVMAGGAVKNPGFEQGEGEIPSSWNVTGNATRVSAGPIYSGNWSAQVTGQGETFTQWIGNCTAGTIYEAWGWIYVSGNTTGVIALDFWLLTEEGTSQLSPTTILSATDTGGEYIQKTGMIQAPKTTTHARIRLYGTGWSDGGEVRFDDIGFWVPAGSYCFIATAAYGTPMAEEIQVLRDFRDGYLLTNPVGEALVDLYYRNSPPVAEFITEHPSLKPIVRAGLAPAIAMSGVVVNTTPAQKMAVASLLALVLVVLAVRTAVYHKYDRASWK